ncbi:hypothetical protein [Phosphitispora sp. TUW77]|uniref:hypothetical protein n=1 Tax=Phosphitispora sp. TUW77 TaxID=3152361 RepID=UPI003AB13A3F
MCQNPESPEENQLAPQAIPVDFETAQAILDIAKKEYEYEADRSKSIDARASTCLSVSAVVFALVANAIKIPKQIDIKPTMILFDLYTGILISLGVTIYFFAKTLVTRQFKRYDVADIAKYSLMRRPAADVIPEIVSTLSLLIKENTSSTDDKVSSYNTGIKALKISILLIGFTMLLTTLLSQ